ncbi:MAG: tRNA (guanosine(46)-N7)-methyltransferase TrmB [Planctomycetia bacterium]|nr:tRNA (guanosine(46)-N7)-methyltransferase TrmB [Planctomycetia bacterium]
MSRSSLTAIQGDLDLTGYFFKGDELTKPLDTDALFGRSAPVELEIGSGKGLFIRKAAALAPEHNFIGIELAYRYALMSAAGLCKRGLTNAKMINADAALILREYCQANSLAAIHVYFPDPWWKKSHRKRRILRTDVLKLIESRLVPGGKLHFWTDVEEYYYSTLDLLHSETQLTGPNEVAEPEAEDDMDFRTHFERRTRLASLPVWRCFFVKSAPSSP